MINDLYLRVAARTWPHQTAHQFRGAGSREVSVAVNPQVGATFGEVDALQQTLNPLHTGQVPQKDRTKARLVAGEHRWGRRRLLRRFAAFDRACGAQKPQITSVRRRA
jgi:hypothetical protein